MPINLKFSLFPTKKLDDSIEFSFSKKAVNVSRVMLPFFPIGLNFLNFYTALCSFFKFLHFVLFFTFSFLQSAWDQCSLVLNCKKKCKRELWFKFHNFFFFQFSLLISSFFSTKMVKRAICFWKEKHCNSRSVNLNLQKSPHKNSMFSQKK